MKVTKILILATIATGLMVSTVSYAKQPMGTYLSNSDRLKLSRYAARNNQSISLQDYVDLDDARDDAFRENNNECGNVEIGNVEGARPGMPRQEVNVVIAGDLIVAPGSGC